MAIDRRKEQQIILLRAEGYSLDKIKEKVKISKPTIMKVIKEKEEEIYMLRNTQNQEFVSDYKAMRTRRAKRIINVLEKAYEAMEKTDYSKLSKRELIYTISILEQKLYNFRDDMKQDTYVREEYHTKIPK